MVVGQPGQHGLYAHLSVTLVTRQEKDFAVHQHHNMGVMAAMGLTYKQGTATPTPVQVLYLIV